MFEQLRIQNFQRHDFLKIDLDPHITTITGPTDSGKSSVLRALRWLCLNRPTGDSFVKNGERSCKVGLQVDGAKIVRSKSPSGNEYMLRGKKFRAFGTSMLEEVENEVKVDSDNFQGQHDPPYWFCLTAGEVTKRLNSIVDLGLIDQVYGLLASKIRQSKTEHQVAENRLAEVKDRINRLNFVLLADRALEKIEELDEDTTNLRARVSRLGDLVGKGVGLRRVIKRAEGVLLGASERISKLSRKIEEIDGLKVEVERLRSLFNSVRTWQEKVAKSDNKIREKKADLEEELGGRCPLCGGVWNDN